MNKTIRLILALIFIGVIAMCSVLIARKVLGRARIDLTEHKNYTLSQGTANIISKINQPIKLKLYYSRAAAIKGPEGFRFFNNYFLYVRDLLEEYVEQSGGRITLEVVDPRAFSEEEEEAIQLGLKRFQISQDESFFFGLVAETELGKTATIELFEPNRQEFVEYDISKLISGVTKREKKKIGVISSLEVMGENLTPMMRQMMQMQGREVQGPWSIVSHLEEEYEVTGIETDQESIPADIDFLMVVHPKDLPEKSLFAIDQFVMNGGRLIVFTDPHCLEDRPDPNPQNPMAAMNYKSASNLNSLLEKWGAKMNPDAIALDSTLAIAAPLQRNAAPQPLAAFLGLTNNEMNKDEIITATLHSIRSLFAGSLKATSDDAKFTPLLTTSPKGTAWTPASPMDLQYLDAQKIYRAALGGSEKVVLAARLDGPFMTNYPDGIIIEEDAPDAQSDEKTTRSLTAVSESSAEASIIVIADVDIISDMLAYERILFGTTVAGDNAALVFNSLDYLSGSSDLIAIRSRGSYERPFTVVDQIEAETEQASADEVEQLNQKIQDYQQKLSQLGRTATDENVKLLQSEALAERQKIEAQMRDARKQLRVINTRKREKIEDLKQRMQTINMLAAPAIILIIAIVLAILRFMRAKRYAARRAEQ